MKTANGFADDDELKSHVASELLRQSVAQSKFNIEQTKALLGHCADELAASDGPAVNVGRMQSISLNYSSPTTRSGWLEDSEGNILIPTERCQIRPIVGLRRKQNFFRFLLNAIYEYFKDVPGTKWELDTRNIKGNN